MPFLEYDAEPILKRVINKTLHIVGSLDVVAESDCVIVTIGTPVDEYLNPKLLPMLAVAEQLVPFLRPDHLIILRSTVFPGTSERLNDFFVKQGLRIDLAFCPERIAQGYAVRELRRLPQIVSGFSDRAIHRARAMFSRLGLNIVEVSVKEAELAKLFLNAWRYIQFAAANQFYMIATDYGADFSRLHHAMTHGYDRAQDFPTAGFAAGPCLLKDTMQLSAFYQNNFLLGHAGMLINEGMPGFIVEQIRRKHDLKKQTVGILGMSFKADVDDIRDSLSLYSDEFAKDPTFISKEDLIKRSSIVIVGVPHTAYRSVTVPDHVELVDIWGAIKKR
jgi:UDP-N-acetyl-D-mannosaminuronic acid dehydrogenase